MAPQKGKQGTKGQKQIFQENKDTKDFYLRIMSSVGICYILFRIGFRYTSVGLLQLYSVGVAFLLLFGFGVYIGCFKLMDSMSKPTYSESGALIDGGIDLNMPSGMAEHIKDVILLTAVTQALGILSDWFWLLWLLVPIRGLYLLWVNILGPWFFAEAPEAEMDPKKQKKLERKMKRAGMMQ